MGINKRKFNKNEENKGFLKTIEEKEWSQLLCCSNNYNSLNLIEQLTEGEKTDLWLKIKQSLSSFNN